MDIFDMVKAAPPPQTIAPVDRKISTPSPIAPDSPYNSDLLESGNLSNDEDLDKQATPDDSSFHLPSNQSSKTEESPFKMPKKVKKKEELGSIDLKSSSDEEQDEPTFKKPRKSEEYHKSPAKPHKKRAAETLEDSKDSSEEEQKNPGPTKTKAQQKMFNDPEIRECRVRVRRLTQLEIDAAFESLAKSPFADSSPRKMGRGRPRKTNPSPPQKKQNKIHIKVPLQNGAKKRAMHHQLARGHTPPPSLSRRGNKSPEKPKQKLKAKQKKPLRGRNASQALIQRFGARFFDCVVRIKRTPWPNPLGKKGRSRKSNLSVSFSEAVEILGSAEGHSRRATFGSISAKSSPKPTRLQRVDATGNVLEDIALTSTPLTPLAQSAGPSTSSGGSREKGKRRSCNGSPMGGRLKRPHQRLPLSSLASLRLDDGPNSGEDEEYIVPNELPGIKRPATPPLKKKKISFTTTISDDEDEKPPLPKKPKDGPKKQPKVLKESVIKKAEKSHKEKERKQEKSNEIVKEKLPLPEIKAADKVEVKPPENEANEVERDGEAQKKSETEAAEEKRDESEEEKPEEEEKLEDKTKENPQEAQEEEAPKEETSEAVEENAEETSENLNESLQNPTEEEKPGEEEEKEELRQLASPKSQLPLLVPSATEDNEEDILEIQTSLDDVRQLHTPSSRLSTPKPRSRLDSGESDCSFKSASDHDKQAAVMEATEEQEEREAEEEQQQAEETLEDQLTAAAITDDELELPANELPAELMTPPSAPRTTNGGDPTSGSSASAPYYSPIESIPTLDDEVLGQLVDYK
ncbi:neurofilament heavy polypeptide isoform X2 [Drosophila takahashii]|uniref:neurofilament heavy polypeptide isoform X2 n=1 Tax=Drosophila takahashii TaxID=29030 RepID=UPI003898DD71